MHFLSLTNTSSRIPAFIPPSLWPTSPPCCVSLYLLLLPPVTNALPSSFCFPCKLTLSLAVFVTETFGVCLSVSPLACWDRISPNTAGVILPHMHVGLRVCTKALSLFIPSCSFFLCVFVFVGEEVCKHGMLACQICSYRLFTISHSCNSDSRLSGRIMTSHQPHSTTVCVCVCPGKYMCA